MRTDILVLRGQREALTFLLFLLLFPGGLRSRLAFLFPVSVLVLLILALIPACLLVVRLAPTLGHILVLPVSSLVPLLSHRNRSRGQITLSRHEILRGFLAKNILLLGLAALLPLLHNSLLQL